MDTHAILLALRNERDQLDAAIGALAGNRKKRGRRTITSTVLAPRKRRRLSAAARKRISASQRKAWAARKNAAKR